MFRALCAHHQRSKLYYTASGIVTPVGGHPVHRCIIKFSPDDEYIVFETCRGE